jgi:hypothetical protein
MPDFIINRKAPIIMGVEILDGQLKMGTPICVPNKEVRRAVCMDTRQHIWQHTCSHTSNPLTRAAVV